LYTFDTLDSYLSDPIVSLGSTANNVYRSAPIASKMADKTPSADQTASSEPRLAEQETKLATNPKGTEDSKTPAKSGEKSVVGKATDAASQAATGVKDSVFSMFGGGAKKEKKPEEDDADEPSGSSKAKKADDEDVSFGIWSSHTAANTIYRRKPRKRKRTSTSNQLST
jgi:hypothetical protein